MRTSRATAASASRPLNDLGPAGAPNAGEGAEWTGGVFDGVGQRFYVSIQHNMTGHGVILEITGWE